MPTSVQPIVHAIRAPGDRLAAWLDRFRVVVLLVSIATALTGGYLATRMPIRSDLASLLPPSKRAVIDLNAIQERVRPFGTLRVVVECDDADVCARAGDALASRLEHLRPDLVAQFSSDDRASLQYAWDHRFLFAELADLEAARDALRERIDRAKLDANPMWVQIDDEEEPDPDADKLDDLEQQLDDAEQAALHPPPRASRDGRLRLLNLQTTFGPSDSVRAHTLIRAVHHEVDAVRREVPGARFTLSGNITLAMYEHDSVLRGMALAGVITVLLAGLGLLLYYRSWRVVVAMMWSLLVGVAATFAFAWLAIGHLNVMTAFLFAIIVGNGVNASLILVARLNEELRELHDPRAAIAAAITGAMRGTLAATATAAVAYISLLVTDFRGFRQFGAIAGVGMLLTWVTTFTVLPAALSVLARRGWLVRRSPPAIGGALARILAPRRNRAALATGAVITAIGLAITAYYIANDPFSNDWRDLQSSTPEIRGVYAVDARVRAGLEQKQGMTGQAYQLAIAVEHRDEVAPLVAKLRADDAARPEDQRWIYSIHSIDDLLPTQQDDKVEVLHEITALIDDDALQATLEDDERARLDRLRPPADIRPIDDADVPVELAWPFIEQDGTRGRLIVLQGSKRFHSFDVGHRLRFAAEVRAVEVPPGALVAGESLVVADIVETMEEDAPKMILFALLGSMLAVLLTVGSGRHGRVTLACGLAGVVVMIAACAVAGLDAHCLDLVALPITIGIGIDYAVNLAARDRQHGALGQAHLVRTTGGTVLLCSFTTSVGYGTLLLSANGGIRAFGLAALLGEIACILMALVVAPAWLASLRDRTEGPTVIQDGTAPP